MLPEVIQTKLVADRPPAVALIVYGPPAVTAEKTPELLIVPPPKANQAGDTLVGLPS